MVFAESTSIPRYWMPLQPSIFIYPKSDFTYNPDNRLYTYYPYADSGNIAKPVALQFETTIGNVGTFTLEIEDSTYTLNLDTLSRGCRVFILCTKNAQDPQAGYKGLVRSVEQKMYGQNGRNIVIKGYSYLIRLKERVVDYSAVNFPTDQLIQALLNDDSAYLYTFAEVPQFSNDTILHADHIWPVTQTIPNASAQLATLDQAISDVTEHTNSLMGLDFNLDQLILYTSDDTVEGDNQIFTITDKLDQLSDRADTTMYPLEPYSYSFGYDYPDSASRLIASIGNNECAATGPIIPPSGGGGNGSPNGGNPAWLEGGGTFSSVEFFNANGNITYAFAQPFVASSTSLDTMKFGLYGIGNISYMNSVYVKFIELIWPTSAGLNPSLGVDLSNWIPCYYHSTSGSSLPSTEQPFWVGFTSGQSGLPTLAANTRYWVAIKPNGTINITNHFAWIIDNSNGGWVYSGDQLASSYSTIGTDFSATIHEFRMDYLQGTVGGTVGGGRGACGGPPNLADAEPNFLVAADMNGVNRIGMVEKTVSGLSESVMNQSTLNEYMFNKIYTSAKPKFRFDYPAVTLPNTMPRAGDIVVHRDSRLNVGVRASPIQTGIINNVNYDFRQDEQGVLGLTRIAISTSGVLRGTY